MSYDAPGGKGRQTRERILNAAERLFLSRGYENVSIDEICASLQLTKGAFYYHFRTKEEIMAHLFIPRLDRYLAEHYHVDDDASAGERLMLLARCTFACGREVGRPVVARSASGMLGGQQFLLHDEGRIHTRILTEAWQRARREGLISEGVDMRTFRLVYSSMLTGVLLNWAAEPEASDADTDWDAIIELMLGRVFP